MSIRISLALLAGCTCGLTEPLQIEGAVNEVPRQQFQAEYVAVRKCVDSVIVRNRIAIPFDYLRFFIVDYEPAEGYWFYDPTSDRAVYGMWQANNIYLTKNYARHTLRHELIHAVTRSIKHGLVFEHCEQL